MRVLKEAVGHTAGLRFQTTERHMRNVVTYDTDDLIVLHAGPGCMNRRQKKRQRPSATFDWPMFLSSRSGSLTVRRETGESSEIEGVEKKATTLLGITYPSSAASLVGFWVVIAAPGSVEV